MGNKLNNIAVGCLGVMLVALGDDAMAAIDFSKAEAEGNSIIDALRGTLATILLTLGVVITGILAAFNKISWMWFFSILLGAFLIFAAPEIVSGMRAAFG